MAATTAYNTARFDADGRHPRLYEPADGIGMDLVPYTIIADLLEDAGDFTALLAVPEGKQLLALVHTNGDGDAHATPTLDGDWIYRTYNSAGTATDVILYNAATAFQAAVTTPFWTLLGGATHKIPASALGYAEVGFKVNVAQATAGTMAVVLGVIWR